MNLWQELKRRRVIRVAAVYLVAAWAVIQVADTVFPALGLPAWTLTFVAVLALAGGALIAEGRTAAALGKRDEAIRAYSGYLMLRANPEPSVRPQVDRVRAELDRLLAAGR